MVNTALVQPLADWLRQEIVFMSQRNFHSVTICKPYRSPSRPANTVTPDSTRRPVTPTLSLVCYHTPELRELADTLHAALKNAIAR
jgi:hypothetical protein